MKVNKQGLVEHKQVRILLPNTHLLIRLLMKLPVSRHYAIEAARVGYDTQTHSVVILPAPRYMAYPNP